MCGIAGIHASGGARFRAALVEGMTQSLAHRGPDDFGFAAFAPGEAPLAWGREGEAGDAVAKTALGNRRLKILDLSPAGHQPMTDASGDLWIAYNGEVYNYLELREELRGRGHEFRSGCDTEVILHAYAEWGTDCFARFNGMWAIALFDRRSGELVLSRDRFGVKPLYVARLDDGIAFASEVKALLAHPDVPRRPNLRTVYNYAARHYRWVDGHRDTFFDGIEQLPAATYWVVSPEGGIREERFWALDGSRLSELSDGEALERFRELFADAVRVRLRADVPVATLLSGGLDSSSVTCMAAHLSDQPVTTFSARFDEDGFDEGRYIEATVRHAGADGRMIHPRSGALLDTLDRMLDAGDEPICTATWFAHWLVMEQVADQGFPVILNGHVGDELFAGYWDHYMYNLADLERRDRDAFEAEMAAWLENHGRDPAEYPRTLERIGALERGALGPADSLTQYDAAVGDDVRAAAAVPDRPDPFAGRDLLTSRLFQELTYETVPAT
ncbi:MAG TPA: asparagine synthase (glutamine-hydrolyzing), partial [Thermoleophilaceae bacterium]|nr:asparagine synthase (glutamine-hydrolyzing) [Thermoleophilaceae bacterium]